MYENIAINNTNRWKERTSGKCLKNYYYLFYAVLCIASGNDALQHLQDSCKKKSSPLLLLGYFCLPVVISADRSVQTAFPVFCTRIMSRFRVSVPAVCLSVSESWSQLIAVFLLTPSQEFNDDMFFFPRPVNIMFFHYSN